MQIYASTSAADEEELEHFYTILQETWDKIDKQNIKN